ncbi:M20 family metallo-hydrolase [Virgibacillus necropolis]|uniref:M20 family metallo-hydrolase n=1 Tax=Virgibacillus necropolis TaxID=163877 RepID=UPI00137483F8|nr:M20 family metallo-hydrolase [Virgibacillus necropolis]
MEINLDRIIEQFNLMSNVGIDSNGGITRLALSQEDKEARDLLVSWMKNVGLSIRVDDVGNIYGRREGSVSDAKPIVLGSHLDSIEDSGQFDGVMGILAALEVVRVLNDYSIKTKRPIEIVNFTNEEGIRFKNLMTGSGVLSQDYDIESVYNEKDAHGKTFLDELKAINYLGKKEHRLLEAKAFVELHIEQGPILDSEKISIGAVEGTLGANWLQVKVVGEESNSGPTPMYVRKDPLISTAKLILEINKLVKEIGERAIITIGDVKVKPGNINTVPGEVTFLVDVRGENEKENNLGVELVIEKLKTIAKEYEVQIEFKTLRSAEPAVFSPEIVDTIFSAADKLGYSVKRMVSGAGHNSSFMNNICPTAMIFVPSVDGKSHNPKELTRWTDIEKGANTLLYTTLNLMT